MADAEGNVRKISVLLPLGEDNRFCAYCKETGHKKSTLIARLIKEHLDKERFSTGAARPSTSSTSHVDRSVTRHQSSGRK